MDERIREAAYTKEFDDYYHGLPQKVRDKYDFVFEIMFTKYVVSTKFVKRLGMVMLNSFVEKGTKQYHAEIKKAERLLKEWEESL